MAFAVDAQHRAVGVDDRKGIVAGIILLFVEADRQHHLQLTGHLTEMGYSLVFLQLPGVDIIIRFFLLAKIRCLKQLLKQDDLCPFGCGLTDQLIRPADVFIDIGRAAHLGSRYGNLSHSCPS
ncbi:hypothetical protein D3C75_717970 [compost metagenome]